MRLRASEVTNRKCRDVDDDGRVRWIDRAKTPTGDRTRERRSSFASASSRSWKVGCRRAIFAEVDRTGLAHHGERIREAATVVRVTPPRAPRNAGVDLGRRGVGRARRRRARPDGSRAGTTSRRVWSRWESSASRSPSA